MFRSFFPGLKLPSIAELQDGAGRIVKQFLYHHLTGDRPQWGGVWP